MHDEVLVDIELRGENAHVGTLHREPRRGYEAVGFEYAESWLERSDSFSLEPALRLAPGTYSPASNQALFGALGDSAPDTWGRQLMRRAERLAARDQGRRVRTLFELDYLLGVADVARTGALRFRRSASGEYLAATAHGVPSVIHLRELYEATDRVVRDEASAEDLRLILAPGSSLGGARPKASITSADGTLAIAKFPKDTDEYSLERWEMIALTLAKNAGINAAAAKLVSVAGRPVITIQRFDRIRDHRIPFLSAMSMLEQRDGATSSYPEIVDALARHGSSGGADARELYRRMAFNVLISNVDDHLRNHAFLWSGADGWQLSPAYDLNPTPVDVRERRLTTNITLDDSTCDLDLVLEAAEYFGLGAGDAKSILREIASAVRDWRSVANEYNATRSEAERMSSAFEHDDLRRALTLSGA